MANRPQAVINAYWKSRLVIEEDAEIYPVQRIQQPTNLWQAIAWWMMRHVQRERQRKLADQRRAIISRLQQ